ncbi:MULTISPECIES: VWA domain-containing protein [Haloarculaceae]|uniref:VWA domain-containing protein n=1 Tax=Natronomonadaceae TaxID=3402413 RepID=UPI0020C9FE0F|nr:MULTISPECIES: VWA domain-containing protein [Haloarculaceae]
MTEYIQAHTGENIEVVLTSHVQTACVLPADADRLIDADATDFDQQAAQQLVDAVDGDYLVLISTNPANLDNLPLDDQLTADRAQQFGLSLHELGHIRYTNISTVADHLDERVDEEYQEFVHGLINYAEDAAIEHQLRAAQSQLAADRLELVNRSLTQMASDLPDTATITFTYRDAIQSYLYDYGIYDSGKSDVLIDPDDPRLTFQSQDDAAAFAQTQDALDDLLATVLSEPDSVKRGDAVLDCWEQTIKPLLNQMDEDYHQKGQEDENTAATGGSSPNTPSSPSQSDSSIPDECEQGESIEPSADPDTDAEVPDESPEDGSGGYGAADADPSDVSESPTGDSPETSGDTPNGEQGESPADRDPSEASGDDASAEPPADFDPENVSLEQTQDGHSTDVLAYPEIGTADTADELAPDDAGASAHDDGASSESDVESDAEPNAQPESTDASPDESGTGAGSANSVEGERDSGVGESSAKDLESTSDEIGGSAAEESGIEEQGDGEPTEGAADSSGASDASSAPSNGQASLSDFLGGDSAGRDSGEAASTDEEATSDGSDTSDTSDTTGGDTDGAGAPDDRADGVPSENDGEVGDAAGGTDGGDTDDTENESIGTTGEDEADIDSDTLDDPAADGTVQDGETDNTGKPAEEAAAPLAEPVYDDSIDERADALSADHDAAHEEANRATPDQDALERDLEETVAALEDLVSDGDTDESSESPDTSTARHRGSTGAGKGSIDSLSVLPQIGEQAPPARWQAATAGADAVGGTLRMALRESRRDQTRSGVTSGSFDRRRAGALARGDVDAFSVRQQGDEKQYDLVLVLDRSSSMSNLIDTAEDAVARFALACEDLGINVAIIDFVHGDARLIKPFSVETEHVQASLLSGKTGGGTPLTDALGLARRLLEQRRDSPLVLIITDGKPGSPGDYQEELQQTYTPVCGLTLALDLPRGQAPERAKDVEQFYDRHLYVHDAIDLDRRLDQFAVMFDGL